MIQKHPIRHRAAAFLILSLAGAFPAPVSAETAAPQIAAGATIASVTVARVQEARMIGEVTVSGTLVPRNEILIYPQVNGATIDTLLVDIGNRVTSGEVLATLNNSTLTAQLAQSQAEFARAEAGVSQAQSQIRSAEAGATQAATALQRSQALRLNGTATQAALDQAVANEQTASAGLASARDGLLVATAQRQQAQAQLDIATLNLDRATLRAPVDGIISARNGQVGAIATSGGEPIFRLIKDGLIEVEAEVIETELGTISLHDSVRLSVAGVGETMGKVRLIAPTVDPRSRLGRIRIELDDAAGLRSGLFASGQIITEDRTALTIPTTAVLSDTDGTYVLVVQDGHLQKRGVTAGLIWQGKREIITGLADGDVVVARAGVFFADGDQINPIFPDQPAGEGVTE